MSANLMRNPMAQLATLIGDDAVPDTYAVILALRCPRCGSAAAQRCRTDSGAPTPPHSARIADAVSAEAFWQGRGVA